MHRVMAFMMLCLGVVLVGCNDTPSPKGGGGTTSVATSTGATAKSGHDHSGWWCREHGIPEDDCLMCKIGEEGCKKNKDWCDVHGYCKSQCFGCDPKLKARFAAQYEAKYGKKPPEPEDNPPGKNPEKK